jgi:superfamily II DNA helicase RecQ
MDFDSALCAVCDETKLSYSLKEEQITAIRKICHNNNVFCVFPTGFGKSDIFALPPLIMNKVGS